MPHGSIPIFIFLYSCSWLQALWCSCFDLFHLLTRLTYPTLFRSIHSNPSMIISNITVNQTMVHTMFEFRTPEKQKTFWSARNGIVYWTYTVVDFDCKLKHNLETTFMHIKSNSTQNQSYQYLYLWDKTRPNFGYIYNRLKYDHKKSSTDTPTMIYTKHILKTKWQNFCQVLLKEWCKIQSIIFLPNFNHTLKSLKRSTDVWKLQILIDCTYHIMTGIFSYHRNHIESCKNWGCQY